MYFSRQIAAGEEITVNYNGIIDDKIHRDQRRIKLYESYQFKCSCAACNLSDEELKTQNEMCDELIAIWNKKQQMIAREIALKPDELMKYYKELYMKFVLLSRQGVQTFKYLFQQYIFDQIQLLLSEDLNIKCQMPYKIKNVL